MTTTVTIHPRGFLSGLNAGADGLSPEQKKAKIEDFGKLSGQVDQDLIEQATELAKLIKLGAVTCRDINAYNALALSVWKSNFKVFTSLLEAGADRDLLLPPFQPPFFTVGGGVNISLECTRSGVGCADITIKSPCTGGVISPGMVIDADSRYSEIFFALQPTQPIPQALAGLGFGQIPVAIIWGLIILVGGTVTLLLTDSVLAHLDGSASDEAQARLIEAKEKLATSQFRERRECIEAGGDASECTAITALGFREPERQGGFFENIVATAFKVGGVFLLGSWLYKKIDEK